MAELEAAACCTPGAQRTCCEAEAKNDCCGTAGDSCGCAEGEADAAADVQTVVRARYAQAANVAAAGGEASCVEGGSYGCGPTDLTESQQGFENFGPQLYSGSERDELPDAAKLASLGCGNPTAVAKLNEGETVLDLGSGGGIDVLLSASRIGPSGKAYGLDMTDEMLDLARENQRQAGVENAEFLKGSIEDVPLPDDSVDVIISNCVINLSADKPAVFREAARVLRPGGRFAVTDVVADPEMDDETRRDMKQWTGCIAGALTHGEFAYELSDAGFEAVKVTETHRIHEHAASAIIRALVPLG